MKTGPTFTVNAVGDPEPVTALTVCSEIRVQEDASVAGWPTVDFKVYAPSKNDSPLQAGAGSFWIFKKPRGSYFQPGELAGYLATVSGSTNFNQWES